MIARLPSTRPAAQVGRFHIDQFAHVCNSAFNQQMKDQT